MGFLARAAHISLLEGLEMRVLEFDEVVDWMSECIPETDWIPPGFLFVAVIVIALVALVPYAAYRGFFAFCIPERFQS